MQTAAVNAGQTFANLAPNEGREALKIEYRWINADLVEKPLLVFLHEGLGSIAMWKTWPQELCDQLGVRGLVYSRPGYGRSTPRPLSQKLPVNFMSEQALDVLPAFLTSIGVERSQRREMWLIGHSDGGSIALHYASAFPNDLAGAVVIAPHVFVEDISVKSISEAKVAYETTEMRSKLGSYHDDVDSAFYGWNDVWLSSAFRKWNIVGELSYITCPLLAIQSEDDQYGTLLQVETIVKKVPGAKLVTLPSGGHSPHFRESERVNSEISGFVLSTLEMIGR